MLKVDNLFKIVLNIEVSFEQYEDDENEDYSYNIKYFKIAIAILRF